MAEGRRTVTSHDVRITRFDIKLVLSLVRLNQKMNPFTKSRFSLLRCLQIHARLQGQLRPCLGIALYAVCRWRECGVILNITLQSTTAPISYDDETRVYRRSAVDSVAS